MPPPSSPGSDGDSFYEAFYGFDEPPFATTTDPRFFYLSTSHQHAYTELVNGLRRREGLLMITGETGTGKTTLCRAVIAGLGPRTFSAILVNPYMTGAEVLRMVVRDLGLVSRADLRRGRLATADVPQLLDTLEGFLISIVPIEGRAVLVLDEAQAVAPGVLDQIRVLSSLEHKGRRLIDIILSGQPRLADTIRSRPLAALDERITRRVTLEPLGPVDIPSYIQHRLSVAGESPKVRFDAAAMQAIADLSQGLPRRVNVLCDRALQLGRLASAATITAPLIVRAEETLGSVHTLLPTEFPALDVQTVEPGLSNDAPVDLVAPPPVVDEAVPIDPPVLVEPDPPAPVVQSARQSGFGSATIHPSTPEAGTRPDLVPPPSIWVPLAATEPAVSAETLDAPESFEPDPPGPVIQPERRSGFGPAAIHPPTPEAGTRPDLVPSPSIWVPLAAAEPAAAAEAPDAPEPVESLVAPGPDHTTESVGLVEPAAATRPPTEAAKVQARQPSGFGPATIHRATPPGGTRPDLAPTPSDRAVRHRPSEASTTADTVAIAAPAIAGAALSGATSVSSSNDSDTAAEAPGDPFGPSDDERAARAAWIKRGGIAAAVVLTLAAVYLGWAWEVRDPGTVVGPAPDAPALDRGAPAGPHPVPPPDDLEARFQIRLRPWRPLPETPSDAAAPVVQPPPSQ